MQYTNTLNNLFIWGFQCLSPENVTKVTVLGLYTAEVSCHVVAVPLVVLDGALGGSRLL